MKSTLTYSEYEIKSEEIECKKINEIINWVIANYFFLFDNYSNELAIFEKTINLSIKNKQIKLVELINSQNNIIKELISFINKSSSHIKNEKTLLLKTHFIKDSIISFTIENSISKKEKDLSNLSSPNNLKCYKKNNISNNENILSDKNRRSIKNNNSLDRINKDLIRLDYSLDKKQINIHHTFDNKNPRKIKDNYTFKNCYKDLKKSYRMSFLNNFLSKNQLQNPSNYSIDSSWETNLKKTNKKSNYSMKKSSRNKNEISYFIPFRLFYIDTNNFINRPNSLTKEKYKKQANDNINKIKLNTTFIDENAGNVLNPFRHLVSLYNTSLKMVKKYNKNLN